MALTSRLFANDKRLHDCAIMDSAHVTLGSHGKHVGLIQTALFLVDGLMVQVEELRTERYGPSTAAAVLAYKRKRKIINHSYQSREDNIVGKMTISSLDADVRREELRLGDFPTQPHPKSFI